MTTRVLCNVCGEAICQWCKQHQGCCECEDFSREAAELEVRTASRVILWAMAAVVLFFGAFYLMASYLLEVAHAG